MIHDVTIIGTGPSGVSAALGLVKNNRTPLVLDVGYTYAADQPQKIEKNFYDCKKESNLFDLMIGENFHGLTNIIQKKDLPPKITAPRMAFVTKDADTLSPLNSSGFHAIQSFAAGGLSNAWGAGLYRYIDDDLKDFPLKVSDLIPYYDTLTEEIGISGDDDDLTRFFGSTKSLLKPMQLSKKSLLLYRKYKKKRHTLNKRGIFMGIPRLGVLSEPHDNRSPCDYSNLEMWQPHLPYIYSSFFTLQKLLDKKQVEYKNGILVTAWTQEKNYRVIHGIRVADQSPVSFKTRKIILAAGTLNTTKIVLNSKKDFTTKLPLIDNPLVQIPLLFPRLIGTRIEKNAFGMTQLNIVFNFEAFDTRLQGSIIELTSPSRAVFFDMFPFAARSNLVFIRSIPPAVMVMYLYFPSSKKNSGYLKLNASGELKLECEPYKIEKKAIKRVLRSLSRLGVFTHSSLVQYPEPGYAIHYAGTLPMKENPNQPYQCSRYGELYGEEGVYVVDGSLFPSIAAKNSGFTLMANAMRIADHIGGWHPQPKMPPNRLK
jgi:choline dehydrogenase-like flavoprotein